MKTIEFRAYRVLEVQDEVEVPDDATDEQIEEAIKNAVASTMSVEFDGINEEYAELDDGTCLQFI